MKKRIIVTGLAALALCLSGVTTSPMADTWHNDGKGWWLERDNGVRPSFEWVEINGFWYYFDFSGYLCTKKWIDGRYYVGSDGAMLINCTTPDGRFVNEKGEYVPDIESRQDIMLSPLANTITMSGDDGINIFYLAKVTAWNEGIDNYWFCTLDNNASSWKVLNIEIDQDMEHNLKIANIGLTYRKADGWHSEKSVSAIMKKCLEGQYTGAFSTVMKDWGSDPGISISCRFNIDNTADVNPKAASVLKTLEEGGHLVTG